MRGSELALQRTGQMLEIPPGDAVHHEGDRGVGGQQGYDGGGDGRQRRRFHSDEDGILRAQLRRIGRRPDRRMMRAVDRMNHQTIGLDSAEMSAPGDYRDLRSGPVQARRQVAADRAGAKNADLHRAPFPLFITPHPTP